MSLFENFARRYFEEAVKDLKGVRRAFMIGDQILRLFSMLGSVLRKPLKLCPDEERAIYGYGLELVSVFVEVFERDG